MGREAERNWEERRRGLVIRIGYLRKKPVFHKRGKMKKKMGKK